MGDAVLVADKSQAQRVKEAVDALKSRGATQAVQLPRDYRPWGWYESLVVGGRFRVKRIVVNPGPRSVCKATIIGQSIGSWLKALRK